MTEGDQQFLALYRKHRFEDQRAFYDSRRREFETARDQVLVADRGVHGIDRGSRGVSLRKRGRTQVALVRLGSRLSSAFHRSCHLQRALRIRASDENLRRCGQCSASRSRRFA